MAFDRSRALRRQIRDSIATVKKSRAVALARRVKNEITLSPSGDFSSYVMQSKLPVSGPAWMDNRFARARPLAVYNVPGTGPRVNLVTDSINARSLFGGVATSLIFSVLLAEKRACDLRIVTRTERSNPSNLARILNINQVEFSRDVQFDFVNAFAPRSELDICSDDLFITTSWWATESILRSVPAERVIYLLQEDERMFYPRGDDHLRCTQVMKRSGVRFVVNSQLLYDHLVAQRFDNIRDLGTWFEPAFSASAFYRPEAAPDPQEKHSFFFYARPNHPRNLFFLGLEAVTRALHEKVLDPEQWDIQFAGQDIPPMTLGGGFSPTIIPQMPWEDYCAFTRRVDLGLCLMHSPHPSYPPLDLAASGAVAVTNRYNSKTSLERYSRNIICKEPTVDDLVQGLIEGVNLATNRKQRASNYRDCALLRDWRVAFGDVLNTLASD